MIDSNPENRFFRVSAILLIATALAKLYAAAGNTRVFLVQDELLRVGYRPLMICSAMLELVVAVFLVTNRNDLRRSLALLGLSGNFLFYHWGSYILDIHLCPCLGNLTDRLPLPKGAAEVLLQFLVLYWFLTSLDGVWRIWGSVRWERILLFARRSFQRRLLRGS